MRLRTHGDPPLSSRADYDRVELEFAQPETRDVLSKLSVAQRATLHEYWIDRAKGELTTALTFEFMLDDLTHEGVPDELRNLAKTAIIDEHRHVDWCLRWARLVDDTKPAEPRLGGTRPLSFEGASAHDNRLLRTVFGCCFSETVAVHVLSASHSRIRLPSVRSLNRLHLREEVPHARLGWALLGWQGVTSRDRDMLRSYVPEMTRLTRMAWQSTRREPDEDLHALGYLSSPLVALACDEAIPNVVLPGLEHLGV